MYRLLFLRLSLLLVITVMVGRLYQLQLVDTDARRYGSDTEFFNTRSVTVAPRRGEIFARDGKTVLAESVPIYNIAITPGRLPSAVSEPERRGLVLGRIAQITGLTATLTLSPALALDTQPGLRNILGRLNPVEPLVLPQASLALTLTIPPQRNLAAFEASRTYSDVLSYANPVEAIITLNNVRRYQTVIVKEDVPVEMALVVRENSNYLPGVRVIEGYQRRYPLSAEIPSLSHILGYTGRISECELASRNPASSWLTSLVDVVSYAGTCKQLLVKQIDPASLGIPPYQNDDQIGKDGLEYSYEAVLRGQIGVETLLVDALERPVSASSTLREVHDGDNLVLTVDIEYQRQVEAILRRWIAEGEQRRLASKEAHKRNYEPITNGVAIAIDPRSGRVLAMVSIPNYDNNVWVDRSRSEELQNLLSPADPQALATLIRLAPLTNRSMTGQYPAGSTLKQFVGAIALQEGVIQPDTKLHDPGILKLTERSGVPFELPNSVRNRDNGDITVVDAMRLSSNVFFASIAGGNDLVTNLEEDDTRVDGLGIDTFSQGLEWFGLGRLTGIDVAGEASGLVPTKTWKAQALRESWTTGDTYNMAIGQGYLEVTPLQLAVAAGAVAIDGSIYQPQMVEQVVNDSGEVVRPFAPVMSHRVPIASQYLATMRQGMRDSVVNGLNIAARDECSGLSIAGKTGTAEYGPLIETSDKRLVRQSHSWFVGFAPYDNPQIVVAVLLEGTGDLGDGSSTMAVPAVTQMMQAYFKTTPPAERPTTCPKLPGENAP
jgi:penicillin-binding protein 2